MRIAFAIANLFPGGGLQRDCIEIAKLIRKAGHEIVIHTARLNRSIASDNLAVVVLPNTARTNHSRQQRFAADVLAATAGTFDALVGFEKLSGLDVLYCADPSMYFRVLQRPYLSLLPRYRTLAGLEGESFAPGRQTQIMLLSQNQYKQYRSAWNTESDRMTVLPPNLSVARRKPEYRTNQTRPQLRAQLGLGADDWAWLAIAVQPRVKGLDRTMRALGHFPRAQLLIAGLREGDRAAANIRKLAQRLGVSGRIKWLGHREDIPEVMAAADLLVHPARYDTTGTVILEAIVNGLPVVATSVCGYAIHIEAAEAGVVVQEPFEAPSFLAALDAAQDPARRATWSTAATDYGARTRLYEGRERAVDVILATARARQRLPVA